MGGSETIQAELLVLVLINRLDDVVQTILKVSIKQLRKEVTIRTIVNHLPLCCDPSRGEVKTFLLQIELKHLEGLHQERTDVIPSLGICFST
jgi:hypothetical protein